MRGVLLLHGSPGMDTVNLQLHSLLDRYRDRIRSALGDLCRGVYVRGSVPRGAFDPHRSDVDLVVLTNGPLTPVHEGRVTAAHRDVAESADLGARISGCFAWPGDGEWGLRGFEADRLRRRDRGALGAVCRRELRAHGQVLFGPDPLTVFPAASRGELEAEMKCNLYEYWAPKARREWPRFFFDEGVDFAVLTLPRILYTLETGELITKQQAAAWLERRFPRWATLVADVRSRFFPDHATPAFRRRMPRAFETRRFVLEMIEHSHALRRR